MTPKATNITYWVCTVIFAALMIFSAAGGLQPSQQAIQLMHDSLGYPVYFIQAPGELDVQKILLLHAESFVGNSRLRPRCL